MKIGIIGPGALGCLFASRLFPAADSSGQDEILLIDHNAARADSLNQRGILYESEGSEQCLAIPVHSRPTDVGPLDVLLSCVKSYDLDRSLRFAAPLLCRDTLLVFLQNGISHLKYMDTDICATPVFATSSEGATRLGPGHIRHAGHGRTWLGFHGNTLNREQEDRLRRLLSLLQKGGISSSLSSDIRSRIWAKLFVNVGINGLTAIHNKNNGYLLSTPETLENLKQLVSEAMLVAERTGIRILDDPIAGTITVCEQTAQNISSMLQDVRNQRPTEIEAINGAISSLGRKHGIATPFNDAIIRDVRAIQEHYDEHKQ